MSGIQVSETEMAENFVAKLVDMKSSDQAYVDVLLPDHEREILRIFGSGVAENPDDPNLREPALPTVQGFQLDYIRSKPGTRGALHAHDTTEVFIPITGRWIVVWGEDEEHEVELGVGDVIAVPPGVYRCFRNEGEEEGLMIGMLDIITKEPGHITWPEKVLERVREVGDQYGIGIDENGDLVRLTAP